MSLKNVCITCGILLLLAIPSWWPYGFYTLLRWVICVASIYVAYGFYKSKVIGWPLFLALSPLFLTQSFQFI